MQRNRIFFISDYLRDKLIAMENYIVSARKYRPDTFASVVGQKALTTTLQNAVKNKQLAHAYLFCGPRGVGKTTCARIFAKTINCMNPREDGQACNECESCQAFNTQRSFNIMELDAASNNSVEDIRLLNEQVRIPPVLGKYKVYIIDEVHMLSQAAFNAFLKTLEEPPAYAVFILATTEKHKIIPTILSRCQIYDFHRIGVNDIQEHLQYVAQSEGISFEPEALNIIAMKADGGMRDALSIFDQVSSFGEGKITYKGVIDNLNVLDYDYYFRLINAFLQHQSSEALLLFNEVLNLGFEGLHFVNGLASHLRDLMVCKDARTLSLLEVSDSIKLHYQQQAQSCDFNYLVWALKLANECCLQYNVSRNKRLLVELCLIRLCQGPETMQVPQPLASAANAAPRPAASTPAPQPAPQVQTAPSTNYSTPQPRVSQAPPATPKPTASASASASAKPGAAHRLKTISLSGNKDSEQSKEETEIQAVVIEENQAFSEDALVKVWNEFARGLKDNPQIMTVMTNNRPVLKTATDFEFTVFQAYTEKSLLELKVNIEAYLREKLHNSHICMHLRISEGEENKKALTPQDQLRTMLEKNPALVDLYQKLDLTME